MTKFEVLLSETARRQLKGLPSNMQERVKKALAELYDDPYRSRPKADIRKLKGPNRDYYRIRIGNYRAIYIVDGKNVMVAKILPRSSAYKWLD